MRGVTAGTSDGVETFQGVRISIRIIVQYCKNCFFFSKKKREKTIIRIEDTTCKMPPTVLLVFKFITYIKYFYYFQIACSGRVFVFTFKTDQNTKI